MINTNLHRQSVSATMRKAFGLLVFSCAFGAVSFSQSGITGPNGTGGYDLGGTVTQPAVLNYAASPNTINFIIQKGTAPYLYVGNDGKVGIGTTPPADNTTNPLAVYTLSKMYVNGSVSLHGSASQKIYGGYSNGGTTSINMYNAGGGLDFSPTNADASNAAASTFRGPVVAKGSFAVNMLNGSSNPANIVWLNPTDMSIRGGGGGGDNFIKLYGGTVPNMQFGSFTEFIWGNIVTSTTTNERMRLTAAGNLYLGSATAQSSTAERLEVTGNMKASNNALAYQFVSNGGTLTSFTGFQTNISGAPAVAGLSSGLRIYNTFMPTANGALYNGVTCDPTINQTTYTGATRGVYINPTLTTAADWRSLDFTNNTGWGIYGGGSAKNYLAGDLLLSNTSSNYNASAALNVESNIKGVLFPRMNTASRNAIVSPANGLLIYNNQTNRFEYCYDNTAIPISSGWKPLDGNGACCDLQGVTNVGAVTTLPITVAGSLKLGLGNNNIASNIAIGATALDVNTTGSDNLAIGSGSLAGNTTGKDNTALGFTAIGRNKMGERNVAVGSLALFKNGQEFLLDGITPTNVLSGQATENTAVGTLALNENVKGNGNTGVGYWALQANVNSNYNTALGYKADIVADNITKSTAIGYNAKVGQSNSIVLGEVTSVVADKIKVGIGTTTPAERLDVVGKTKTENFQMTNGAVTDYVLTSIDGNGNAEWKDSRGLFEDKCEIRWTACRLGILPTNSDLVNKTNFLAAIARPDIHTIWFEGGDFTDVSVYWLTGTIDCGGKVLKFEKGNKLTGDATITNFIIDASQEDQIFDLTLNISPIATTDGWFSVKWFGAKGDNQTQGVPHNPVNSDDHIDYNAIQKSINTCISSGLPRLKIPKGSYMITQPLIIRSQHGFVTLILEGEGALWNGATTIYPTFNDAFAIGIQLGKGCKIKNLAIAGKFTPPSSAVIYEKDKEGNNTAVITQNDRRGFMETSFDDFEDITTVAVPASTLPYNYTVSKARDKRFSPYAGIVIDPFTTIKDVGDIVSDLPEWKGYPGLDGQYGLLAGTGTALNDESGSSAIEIDNVNIGGFVVGIASAVNGYSLNQEFMKITRVRIDNCKLSVSAAQAQEKANVIDGLACWGGTHTVFATAKYGLINYSGVKQAGYWHLSNFNLAGAVVQLIDNYQGGWYPVQIDNIYAESIGQFGSITSRNSSYISNGTQISNSVFVFDDPTVIGLRRLIETDGGTTFKNCLFRYNGGHPFYKETEEEAAYKDYHKGIHKSWKKNLMMVLRCKESVFEDCAFSGVPIQEYEMGSGSSFMSKNIYKNCTAAKYTFGQITSREVSKLWYDDADVEDQTEHPLFYNDYKAKDKGSEKINNVVEAYQFNSNEVFVNFIDKLGDESYPDPWHAIEVHEGYRHTSNTAPPSPDVTQQYTEFTAYNTDAFYIGAVVAFNSALTVDYSNAVAYGVVTEIDKGTKQIKVSYVSSGLIPGGKYQISCLYPAVQCGSFMGDIASDKVTIDRVAADWGGMPDEYVGNLIKCPYNNSLGGWVKIVSYENPNYHYVGGNGDLDHSTSDHNTGTFKILGNNSTGLEVQKGTYYFNNGATKTTETTKWNNPVVGGYTHPYNVLIFYKGQKIVEYEKSDIAREYLCGKTGYRSNADLFRVNNGVGWRYYSQSEKRLGCIIELPSPKCDAPSGRPTAGRAGWDLKGNTILASATEKGVDSSDEAADADTSQFLGTINKVGLRIRTGNEDRMAIDKSGTVTIGKVDLSAISNHKDPKQNYLFAVKGNAIFERAVVKLSGNWPDYVFDDKYKLLTLKELEAFIKENKHLPGLPAAEEVQKTGIDIGNNQAALLNKLEELTLYVLQQNKKSEEQNKQIEELKTQNSQLLDVQKQIDELKKAINKQPVKPAE